ncbi:hypothetical protein ACVNIS_16845 [Sphaerotilaceae bacterium SBD11-9]
MRILAAGADFQLTEHSLYGGLNGLGDPRQCKGKGKGQKMSVTANPVLDEKALRKIWLKKKFASWEYHEELLKLHDEYLSSLHRHWARPDIQQQFPDHYRTMQSPVFLNFDQVSKPGQITRSSWNAKKTAGEANAISYNFNRGMDFANCNEYAGMDDVERDRLNVLVGLMLNRAENIRITVEQRWDDSSDEILVEKYTGPIDWPTNWREELLGPQGAALLAEQAIRVKAGEPVPQAGLWQAVDIGTHQRRLNAGDKLPDLGSSYGITVWQLIGQ